MTTAQIIEIVGQACGVLIIIANPLATQFPKRWQIMIMFCLLNLLSTVNQLCVGSGYASALGCGVATIHCAINAFKAKKEIETKLWENVLWAVVYFAAWGFGVYLAARLGLASWLDIFPFFGTVTFLGSVFFKKEQTIRLFTFGNNFVYGIYNVINLNVTAVSQFITMISIIIALIRYRKKPDETVNEKSPSDGE